MAWSWSPVTKSVRAFDLGWNVYQSMMEFRWWSSDDGVSFSRTEDGKIYQHTFGGQSLKYGKGWSGIPLRSCYRPYWTCSPSHSLWPVSPWRHNTNFFIEYFALDLITRGPSTTANTLSQTCHFAQTTVIAIIKQFIWWAERLSLQVFSV